MGYEHDVVIWSNPIQQQGALQAFKINGWVLPASSPNDMSMTQFYFNASLSDNRYTNNNALIPLSLCFNYIIKF